jgi:hypothetical protein
MMKAAEISQLGMQELAASAPPQVQQQRIPSPAEIQAVKNEWIGRQKPAETDSLIRYINPLHAPRMEELKKDEAYLKILAQGLLAGGAAGVLAGALTKQNPLAHSLLGALSGGVGAVTRRFDLGADPPGLSPVYTVPAGARLGALSGGLTGAAAGRISGLGALPGLLTGVISGAAGGTIASPWI